MTTIATFFNVDEAHLLRMRLEADGIEAFIQDELVNFSEPIGGVRVQVADADVAAAREYLTEDSGIQEPDL